MANDITMSIKAGKTRRLNTAGTWSNSDIVITADDSFPRLIDGTITRVDDDSVTAVKDYAFYSCSNLTNVYLRNAETIGEKAFGGCNSLTSVNAPKAKSIDMSGITNIKQGVLRNCSSLETLTIPFVGATENDTGSSFLGYFFGAPTYSHNKSYVPRNLKSVVIAGGTVIWSGAFAWCSSITSVRIPDSITTIMSDGGSPFLGCPLDSIEVDPNNPVFHSAGNCLIDTAYKVLIAGSSASVIPADGSVVHMSNYAFYGNTSLESITIPDSITTLGESAFGNCTSLTTVYLPATLKDICNAFHGCSLLENITYSGTMEQWEAVDKIYDWDANTGSYTIHCTDGDITK